MKRIGLLALLVVLAYGSILACVALPVKPR